MAAAATFNHIYTSGCNRELFHQSICEQPQDCVLLSVNSFSCGQGKVFICVLTHLLMAKARSVLVCGGESWPCCPSAPGPPGNLCQPVVPTELLGCAVAPLHHDPGLTAELQQQEFPAGKMLRKR